MPSLPARTHDDGRSRLLAFDHGAHLASWELDGQPVTWLSPRAVLDGSAAIRGGVPICFPWFGAGPSGDLSPSHGVARTATWLPSATADGEVWAWELSAQDVHDAPGAQHLPGPFHARYAVRLTGPSLGLTLGVTNTGATAYQVEVALHTYLAVPDVRRVQVLGLDGVTYLDKVTGRSAVQSGRLMLTGPTDRVYDSPGEPEVVVAGGGREVVVASDGLNQTVVWNPWAEAAGRMGDLGPETWTRFLCVESAATGHRALTVEPRATVEVGGTVTVRVAG